ETASAIGDWIFQDLICRWGTLVEIVTDNRTPFLKALAYLESKYYIHYIRISGYNSRANGLIRRLHFDVCESTVQFHSIRQSRVTPIFFYCGNNFFSIYPNSFGFYSYIAELIEIVQYLQGSSWCQIQMGHSNFHDQLSHLHYSVVFEARLRDAVRFEIEHAATIRDYNFKRGDLVLMRNTAIEKSLSKKMCKCYLGPLVVISHNRGGAYILCELDGSVFHQPIAAFRVIPYFARTSIALPRMKTAPIFLLVS
ncbi:hypothetical protein K438DRAFT_1582397, partial [Mycena galopus ATCC 62051]